MLKSLWGRTPPEAMFRPDTSPRLRRPRLRSHGRDCALAVYPCRGRQARPEAITATGPTEIAALDALAALLVARATR